MLNGMTRADIRDRLSNWGCWPEILKRLLRDKEVAKKWLDEDGGEKARELLKEIDTEIDLLLAQRATMSKLVAQLPGDEQHILVLHYEQKCSWVQIGMRLNCDERTARRIETRAVDRIAKLMDA